MTLILCEEFCQYCGSRLVKNPLCSGDYYPTIKGLVLQSYCPSCGVMTPPVSIMDGYISNKIKQDLAVRCARICGRGFIEMKKIAKAIPDNKLCFFLDEFLKQANVPPHVIHDVCEQLGI